MNTSRVARRAERAPTAARRHPRAVAAQGAGDQHVVTLHAQATGARLPLTVADAKRLARLLARVVKYAPASQGGGDFDPLVGWT